ncbi:MAG: hypothetical protein IKP49_04395, partial [Treponema sp.]|nr:hypothetical protein [Treponema sp.]
NKEKIQQPEKREELQKKNPNPKKKSGNRVRKNLKQKDFGNKKQNKPAENKSIFAKIKSFFTKR